eukprot:2730616-Pyramimonas_sp.AAC.1
MNRENVSYSNTVPQSRFAYFRPAPSVIQEGHHDIPHRVALSRSVRRGQAGRGTKQAEQRSIGRRITHDRRYGVTPDCHYFHYCSYSYSY